MNRKDLLDKLIVVKPALASRDLIPLLSHFWFSKGKVTAFNDEIAITTPCDMTFNGAIHGETLVNMLKASRAPNVEFQQDETDSTLVMQASKAKIKLNTMELQDDVFSMPKPKGGTAIKGLVDAIKGCMLSISDTTSTPDERGITVIQGKEKITLFSTTGRSMTSVDVPCKTLIKDRVIIPTNFCKQVISLSEEAEGLLEVHDDYVLFTKGDITLFGKLIISDKPLDFVSLFDQIFSQSNKKNLIEIPTLFKWILKRATIMLNNDTQSNKTALTIKDEVMRLVSKSPERGEVVDTLKVPGHRDVSVKFNPKAVSTGCENFNRISISKDAIIMTNKIGNPVYMVAVV